MDDRRESHGGDSGTRPFELSRRSFINVGAAAAGLSVVGFSSVGLAGPAFAAPGKPGEPCKVVPFGPVDETTRMGTWRRCSAGNRMPAEVPTSAPTMQSVGK